MIELPKIFDSFENRYRLVVLHSDANVDKFKRFVEFVQTKCAEDKKIIPKKVVNIEGCPVKDQETAKDYLDLMERTGFHLKSRYPHRKVYFFGCPPEEDAKFKRIGFEGWAGVEIEAFLREHPLMGSIVFERVYRFLEYRDPPFPILGTIFPLATDFFTRTHHRRRR